MLLAVCMVWCGMVWCGADLLPLKAGIASIAFGVLEKHGISVPIVPVGLNYFRGHRFR